MVENTVFARSATLHFSGEKERERDRERDRDKETEREKERVREKKKEREREVFLWNFQYYQRSEIYCRKINFDGSYLPPFLETKLPLLLSLLLTHYNYSK